MICRTLSTLSPEEARQWLIANDREAAEFWKQQDPGGLVAAVKDNLSSFGYDEQLGQIYVAPMKQYVGIRSLIAAEALLNAAGWKLDFTAYDQGNDFVYVESEHDTVRFYWSPFNGHFFGETIAGIKFSHDSAELDHEPFYEAIMNMLYIVEIHE